MKISAAKNNQQHHLFVKGRRGVHKVDDAKI